MPTAQQKLKEALDQYEQATQRQREAQKQLDDRNKLLGKQR